MDVVNVPVIISESNDQISVKSKKNTESNINTCNVTYIYDIILNKSDKKLDLNKLTCVELSNCNLSDLPIEFENLPLKHLDISRNCIKNVPACIYSGLEHLEHLNIGHNLVEKFDLPPGCFRNIKSIKLNHNLLENIPKWILNFRSVNLEECNFSFNRATNYSYNEIYKDTDLKMKKLKLRNSRLIDDDYKLIKCFNRLEYLDISNKYDNFSNKLREIDNLFVKLKWKALKVLKMNNLALAMFPEGVNWIESLTELYLKSNYISWIPDGFQYLIYLEVLDLSCNNLVSLPDLSSLQCLRVLIASHNNIEVIPDLKQLPSLKILDLYDNILDNVSINEENIDCYDLDFNYIDTSLYKNYDSKKSLFRKTLSINDIRIDYQKTKPIDLDYEDSKSDLEYSDCDLEQVDLIIDEENWDDPPVKYDKNPEIDTEDEDWKGDEKKPPKCKKNVRKIYVEDDEWMFEDVE